MRPWPHEVHVAPQDIDELGQLVDSEPPEPLPHPRDPIAIVPLPLGLRPADRMHGAELDQLEGSTAQPDALLDEEHRAARVELDQEHDQTEEGCQDDQAGHRREQAEGRSEEHTSELQSHSDLVCRLLLEKKKKTKKNKKLR